MRRFPLLLLVALAWGCGGGDEETPSKCGDELNEIHAADGTVYCIPEAGSGKALCVIEPADDYNPCLDACGAKTLLAVTYYPWVDGAAETECKCIPPYMAEECNRIVDDLRS